ncbi:MAG: FAD-dependent monooxygenase [Acidimicrobiales bacterium]|nr:FAD-dependent monooxygenase [Acidimicrobiales bacterium]MBO0886660.1 FAD-dependent monooxygenase [Acidimicrobiales bacterium]
MTRRARIAVIGGGIGGLTAAQALRQRGLEVRVYEAAPELKEIGAGVALGPNAMKALRLLGLEAAVRAVAFESEYQLLRNWRTGRIISRTARRDSAERYGAAGCSVHRADLLDVLAAALPADLVQLGARCDGVRVDHHVAAAHFTDGTEQEADVVVGADGIHSAVRASLFGPDAPRFTGKICYRAVIPIDAVAGGALGPDNATWLGPHGAVVVYRVRQGQLVNVVAHYDDDTYQHESWITECDRREVTERYRGWWTPLERLFSVGDTWYKWALYDRDPIPRWTEERATLLGDAAHPMLPYLGQGACQAMEDGCVLAAVLDAMGDEPAAALRRYEELRRPRASRVVITSRERGEDNHLVSRWDAWRRDARIAVRKRFSADRSGRNDGWIAAYDPSSALQEL